MKRQRGLPLLVKKAFDRTVAAVGLVIAAPVIGACALAVRAQMGSPVFFRQPRPGVDGKPFGIVKLRTMLDARGPTGEQLPDEERLTPLGKFLRSTSLDELPQLWNVVSGDLSLVGPRPLLVSYLDLYSPTEARRHDVLPGITGWTAVNGRNDLDWNEKLRLDVWYVDHWSLALDAKILARTVWTVLRRSGVSSSGHATMPPLTSWRDRGVSE